MTRRFCYIQYVSPDAARAALSLHGKELESGLAMNVYISNPERKKERTDAAADEKEIYVAGLSKFVTKTDLLKLFKTVRFICRLNDLFLIQWLQYGTVKDVRVQTDDAGLCKGVAFVEFDEEVCELLLLHFFIKMTSYCHPRSQRRRLYKRTITSLETGASLSP